MNNTTVSAIRQAVEAGIPAMAQQHVSWMRSQIDYFSKMEPLKLRRLNSSFCGMGGAYRAISRYMHLNDAALLKIATQAAIESAESIIAKLTNKLGALTQAEMPYQNGGTFTLTGMLGNRRVSVVQQRVFKISPKGTPFNQWPARIYVDGKIISESAFSKLVTKA